MYSLLLALYLTLAPKFVTIQTTPSSGFVPLPINIKVRIIPKPENRALCLYWGLEGEGMYSSSCESLEGENTRKTWDYHRYLREPGTWVFVAQVSHADGTNDQDMVKVVVIGEDNPYGQ